MNTVTSPAVYFKQAAFSYASTPVLTGVTGQLAAGQALALVGPNGSGKTTLLRGILGLVPVSAGEVTVLNRAPGKAPKGSIGYVPQVSDLDKTFPVSVEEVVLMGLYSQLGFWRRPGKAERERAHAALAQVGLAEKAKQTFGTLSGGQQQRVLVARCVAAQPQLVLLDEPFNGLDQPNRNALLQIISEIKAAGIAVVVSTHDLVLANEVCELVALLAGRQIAFGPRAEVLIPKYIDLAYGGCGNDQVQRLNLDQTGE